VWIFTSVYIAIEGTVPARRLQNPPFGVALFHIIPIPSDKGLPLYKKPIFWAGGAAIFFAALQWIFW
jgi:hypothetical protein